MSSLKKEITAIEKEMNQLEKQVLEAALPYEKYLVASGRYRALKSVRDRMADRLQKQQIPDSADIESLAEDVPAGPAAKRSHKPRSW